MDLTPRTVSVLAFLALVPVGIYGASSGEFTPLIGVLAVLCVLLISGSLLLMFGPSPEGGEGADHGTSH